RRGLTSRGEGRSGRAEWPSRTVIASLLTTFHGPSSRRVSPAMSDPQAAPFPPIPYESWRRRVETELGEESSRRLARQTLEGLTVEALYAADHLPGGVPLPRLASTAGG